MAKKLVEQFQFDGDPTSVYGMIEEINESLEKYGLALEIDDNEHDGYEVVELFEITDNRKSDGDE